MPRLLLSVTIACLLICSLVIVGNHQVAALEPESNDIQVAPADWPWWRGPTRNGVAASDQQPPLKWSETENVLWQARVPGRGHGSPTVVGDRVFLATADQDREVQSLLCYNRQTGAELWQTTVHQGSFEKKGNEKSSLASSTAACDGQRVYINFLHAGAIYTTALSLDGKIVWQKKIADYILHQGFGSSPAIYKSLVIVSADNKGGAGAIVALDRATGEEVWRQPRPKFPNYASPIILNVAGREQVLLIGCELVTSLEPLTGKKIWEVPGSTTECVTSTVTDGERIYTSGGYPKNHISAVRADGSGEIVWENTLRVYVPSLLSRDGYLYAVMDAGTATCLKSDTGKEVWKGRINGTFSASPVLVGEHIFATSESGKTYIFEAKPDGFKILGENQLGDEVFSSPTICGSRIYIRAAKQIDGQRQEILYCVGTKD